MRNERIVNLIFSRPSIFRAGFSKWITENRAIFDKFELEALRVWQRGRKHYSARTIIEVIRHETLLSENGSAFKVNNNIAPDCARLYALMHPEHIGLFEFRGKYGRN